MSHLRREDPEVRRCYRLQVVNTGATHRARAFAHALELVDEKVSPGDTWRVTVQVGAGDEHLVRTGVRASDGGGDALLEHTPTG